jgi:hypothetical protein
MTETAQILAAVSAINDRIGEIQRQLSLLTDAMPPLPRREFAAKVGRNPNTITQWIKDGRIRTRNNRIPYSELKKFL